MLPGTHLLVMLAIASSLHIVKAAIPMLNQRNTLPALLGLVYYL